MTTREFLGEEWFKWATADLEAMRHYRNQVAKGRCPTDLERIQLDINKPWEGFFRRVLRNWG